MKELNHILPGMLSPKDFYVVYAKHQEAMAEARNALTQMTMHMNKMKILLGDLSTGRLTPNVISSKDLNI